MVSKSNTLSLTMTNPSKAAAYEKWGEGINAGFQVLPDVLLKNQEALGLSCTELVVLIHLTMCWWFADRYPFPRTTTIARRMGVTPRTVQRALLRLRSLNLARKLPRTQIDELLRVRPFDLSGLVGRLEHLAQDDPYYLRNKLLHGQKS